MKYKIIRILLSALFCFILFGCDFTVKTMNIDEEFIDSFYENYMQLRHYNELWQNTLGTQNYNNERHDAWIKMLYYETLCSQYVIPILNNQSNDINIQQRCDEAKKQWEQWQTKGYSCSAVTKSKYGGFNNDGMQIELLSAPITSHGFDYNYTINQIRQDEVASDFLRDSCIYVDNTANMSDQYYAVEIYMHNMVDLGKEIQSFSIFATGKNDVGESVIMQPLKTLDGTGLEGIFDKYNRTLAQENEFTLEQWYTFVFKGPPYDEIKIMYNNETVLFGDMINVYMMQ